MPSDPGRRAGERLFLLRTPTGARPQAFFPLLSRDYFLYVLKCLSSFAIYLPGDTNVFLDFVPFFFFFAQKAVECVSVPTGENAPNTGKVKTN